MAEADLALLDRIQLKLAMTEEAQLQEVAGAAIPRCFTVLGGANGMNDAVKKKTMEILTHINKRVKDQTHIQLPLEELLRQYNDPTLSAFAKNFVIIYIEMAFKRAPSELRGKLVPGMLQGISGRVQAQRDMLLFLATGALGYVALPKIRVGMPRKEGEDAHVDTMFTSEEDRAAILDYMLDVLLYTPSSGTTQPGVSRAAIKRLLGNDPTVSNNWTERKAAVVRFLGDVRPFRDSDVFAHLLVGCCDNNQQVSMQAESHFKRLTHYSIENPELLSKLFRLFLGVTKDVPADDLRSACNTNIRCNIMGHLVKSRKAANSFPKTLEVVFHCLFGNDNSARLKQSGMQFVGWIFLVADDSQLKPMAPVILNGLLKIIDAGAVVVTRESLALRESAYSALGAVGKRCPELIQNDISIVEKLFLAVYTEESSLRTSVQEALSLIAPAFVSIEGTARFRVLQLLMECSKRDEPAARLAAVQWANRVFPFSDPTCRYICITLSDDINTSVRDEAQRGTTAKNDSAFIWGESERFSKYPSFSAFVKFTAGKLKEIPVTKSQEGLVELPFSVSVHSTIIKFARSCLEANAANTEGGSSGTTAAECLAELCEKDADAVVAYRFLVEQAMCAVRHQPLVVDASYQLLEVIAAKPDTLANIYLSRLPWLRSYLRMPEMHVRENAARSIGLVGAILPDSELLALVDEMIAILKGPEDVKTIDLRHGTAIALGCLLGRVQQLPGGRDRVKKEKLVASTECLAVFILSKESPLLPAAGCMGLGVLASCAPLAVPDGKIDTESKDGAAGPMSNAELVAMVVAAAATVAATSGEDGSKAGASAESAKAGPSSSVKSPEQTTKVSLVKSIAALAQNHDNKIVERAVTCIGQICCGEPDGVFLPSAIDGLVAVAANKSEELQFCVGEALSSAVAGWKPDPFAPHNFAAESSSLHKVLEAEDSDQPMTEANDPKPGESNESMKALLNTIIYGKLMDKNSAVRCSGCVWLLCLLRYAPNSVVVADNLGRLQMSFCALLGDEHDITQEVASKGLSLIYNRGTGDMKNDLLDSLVASLQTGQRVAPRASGTSEELPEDAFGGQAKAPKTYKEICGLASDVGKPELVYHLMELANHSKLWTSRRGAAFGVGTIAKIAGEKIKPYMNSLVPKLYRYQFDPNQKIQESMSQIWKSIVQDPKAAVEEHYDEIVGDILTGMGSRQWRVRQACCLALSDLIPGRTMEKVGKFLERMWNMTFRCLDDIKDTVREAGLTASRAMGSMSVRLCNPSSTSAEDGERAISIVLPFLMNNGLVSPVAEIRKATISNLLKITKFGGDYLKPYASDIVVSLLEALSSLEPEAFNYAQFHTEEGDAMEQVRVRLATEGPVWESIMECLKVMDKPGLDDLVPRVAQLARAGVGLPTLTGSSKVINTLAMTNPDDIKSHASRIFHALTNALGDRSATVRRTAASTISSMVKLSDDELVGKYFKTFLNMYINAEEQSIGETSHRGISGYIFREIGRTCSEKLKTFGGLVFPIAFVARHDGDETVKKIWTDVWNENSGASTSSMDLFLDDIIRTSLVASSNNAWTMRRQGALAFRDVAEMCREDLGCHFQTVYTQLRDALPGQLWDGKESILKALDALGRNCAHLFRTGFQDISVTNLLETVIAECDRPKREHRKAAVDTLISLLKTFPDADVFDTVFQSLRHLACDTVANPTGASTSAEASNAGGSDSSAKAGDKPLPQKREREEGEEYGTARTALLILQSKAFEAIGRAWPKSSGATQAKFAGEVHSMLCDQLVSTTWMVRLGIVAALTNFYEVSLLEHEGSPVITQDMITELTKAVPTCLDDAKHTNLRFNTLRAIDALHLHGTARALLRGNPDLVNALEKEVGVIVNDKEAKVKDMALTLRRALTSIASGN